MQRFADSHTRLEDAEQIARFLIEDRFASELSHLRQARIVFVLSQREVFLRGHRAHAYICAPKVQGAMSALVEDLLAQFAVPQFEGFDPDFVIRFDKSSWDDLGYTEPALDYWRSLREATPATVTWTVGRERLVFHELKHIVQRTDSEGAPRFSDEDGRPVLALRPHDAELFHDELTAYGPSLCDAVDTAVAIAQGGRREQQRERARTTAA